MIITWHCYLINCELNISYENEIENISNHYILDLKKYLSYKSKRKKT